MPTATRRTAANKSTKPKAAPAPVVDEDEELEELDESTETDTPVTTAKAQEVTFGVADLCKVADKVAPKANGEKYTTREMRTLLRRLARAGTLNREIVPGNRTRYDWSGPKDPEVQKVLKALKAGELEAEKNEKLQALKDSKAKQREAAAAKGQAATGKTAKKAAAKPAPVVEEADEDDEELELDDDE